MKAQIRNKNIIRWISTELGTLWCGKIINELSLKSNLSNLEKLEFKIESESEKNSP